MNRKIILAIIGICLAFCIAESGNDSTAKRGKANSQLRFVNLHPQVTPVRILVRSNGDERVLAERLDYRSASIAIPADIEGDTILMQRGDDHATLTTYTLRPGEGRDYLVVALPLGATAFIQEYFRTIGPLAPQEKGFVNFIQASPDANAVSVEITDRRGYHAMLNAPGFGPQTNYDTTLVSGQISVVVRSQQTKEVLIEGSGELPGGVFASIILSGKVADSSLTLSLLNQTDASAQVPIYRLGNASSVGCEYGGEEKVGRFLRPMLR